MVIDCAFCGESLGVSPERCLACRRGQPVDRAGYVPRGVATDSAWFASATAMPMFIVGAVLWSFGFLRSFGVLESFDDLRLATAATEMGRVTMLAAVFAIGMKAVRRLETAKSDST